MNYWAELDGEDIVQRVVVCNGVEWLNTELGGTWVMTGQPYQPDDVSYPGPGWGHDDTFPETYAPAWQPWDGTFDVDNSTPYQVGTLVFHNGSIWRSTTANNIWEPGVSGWHDAPEVGHPAWVQPTGAHDAYALGAIVTHQGQTWQSTVDANVWPPGVFGWVVIP